MDPRNIIQIQTFAFEEILRACLETLNVESIGRVFGERCERRKGISWIIESAHPAQLAKRYPASSDFEVNPARTDFSLISEKLGDYHSHPTSRAQVNGIRRKWPGQVYLSEGDRKDFEGKDRIEIVVGLRHLKRKSVLEENPLLTSGYIEYQGRIYRFDIGGYYRDRGFRRAIMRVPRKVLKQLR